MVLISPINSKNDPCLNATREQLENIRGELNSVSKEIVNVQL